MSRRSLALFDLDGTLVDTTADIAAAVDAALVAVGRAPVGARAVRAMIGHGVHHLLRCALGPSAGDDEVEAARRHFGPAYRAALCVHSQPFPGIRLALHGLRLEGVRCAIATNKPAAFTGPLVENLFADTPLVWASADECPARKPDPAVLELAARRAEVAPDTPRIYVGDMTVDRDTAHAAGIPFLGVGWGLGAEALRDEGERLVSDASELVDRILEGLRRSGG